MNGDTDEAVWSAAYPETQRGAIRRPVARGSQDACLVHIYPSGPGMGLRYALGEHVVLIGRGEDCPVQIQDNSVSRRHARIEQGPDGYYVYDLRSTKAVAEEVLKAGGKPIRGRVGHVFLKQSMADQNACFGGELSGHFYFKDNYNADSGAIAMCTVLTMLAQAMGKGKAMSQLINPIARYAQSGDAFVVRATPKFELLNSSSLGETSMSSIAPSNGELFIRTYKSLWCITDKTSRAKTANR